MRCVIPMSRFCKRQNDTAELWIHGSVMFVPNKPNLNLDFTGVHQIEDSRNEAGFNCQMSTEPNAIAIASAADILTFAKS